MILDGYFYKNYTLYSILVTIILILAIWFLFYNWKYEMAGEPFVSGIYNPEKSSNWVYFPVFGQRMSRSGIAYYDHPFDLYLRDYKAYSNIPTLPVKPILTEAPPVAALTANTPAVLDTGKKALVTVPTNNGDQQVIAPIISDNGTDKAIVSLPTTGGNSNITIDVPPTNT